MLTLAIVGEQICYGDLGIGVAFDQTWKIMTTLAHLVSDDQRRRWMPRIVDDPEFLLGIGATEPMHGSDNLLPYDAPGSGMQTRAERRGDTWVLNGTKRYISNGGLAKLYYVLARTDAKATLSQGLTGFLVPADAPGFAVTEVWDKLGQRTVQNGTLQFDNVEIPDADRVGDIGKALPAIGAFMLRYGSNIQAGASVLGVAQRAYDLSPAICLRAQRRAASRSSSTTAADAARTHGHEAAGRALLSLVRRLGLPAGRLRPQAREPRQGVRLGGVGGGVPGCARAVGCRRLHAQEPDREAAARRAELPALRRHQRRAGPEGRQTSSPRRDRSPEAAATADAYPKRRGDAEPERNPFRRARLLHVATPVRVPIGTGLPTSAMQQSRQLPRVLLTRPTGIRSREVLTHS